MPTKDQEVAINVPMCECCSVSGSNFVNKAIVFDPILFCSLTFIYIVSEVSCKLESRWNLKQ